MRKFSDLQRELALRLGHLELSKNCIILPPTGHIVRGFLFERTAYKDHYYVWALIAPLFSPTESISLNYSERVVWDQGHAQALQISETSENSIKSEVLAVFERHLSSSLSKISTVTDFIDRFPLTDTRPNMIFEHAVAHWLVGDFTAAREAIRILEKSSLRDRQLITGFPTSEKVIASLKSGEDALSLIRSIEDENIKKKFPGITIE